MQYFSFCVIPFIIIIIMLFNKKPMFKIKIIIKKAIKIDHTKIYYSFFYMNMNLKHILLICTSFIQNMNNDTNEI